MEMDHMKKALQSRRGKGVDISIVLGPHDSAEQDKKSDLAPAPDHPLDVDQGAGIQMPHPENMGLADADLMHGMSDFDKTDMAAREPRSLGERAKQAMMMKMSKK